MDYVILTRSSSEAVAHRNRETLSRSPLLTKGRPKWVYDHRDASLSLGSLELRQSQAVLISLQKTRQQPLSAAVR
jgi:hypothetical protein